jgi:Tol biopolymer transport system component
MKYVLLLASLALPGVAGAAQFDDIVFSSSGELCTVASVPGAKERCLRSDYEYDSPAWRPNGKVLVVKAGVHDGPSKLLIIGEDAKVIRTVTKSAGFIRAAWSPDGKYFYALNYGLGRAVGRWNAEGTAFTTLPVQSKQSFDHVQMIAFSPNGTKAALLVDDFKKMLIARVNDSGFEVEQVLPANFSYVAQAAWLDDSRLLFVGKKDDPRAQVWELEVSHGSVRARGIEGLWIRDFLAMSPDRTSVVVCGTAVGDKETRWSLWKYSLASSALTRLTNGIEDVAPGWRP